MRLDELRKVAIRRRLDQVLVMDAANVLAFAGVRCDNAALQFSAKDDEWVFHTDFRYVPMVHRVAPTFKVRDIRKLRVVGKRIGHESNISHARFMAIQKLAGKGAKFVDITSDLAAIRAVKTEDEIERLRAAERLNCEIWKDASERFRPGMTERDMAKTIRKMMIDRGDGEAFDTIVCVGRNAAECHHEPDDTVWSGREPVLVDMGVKLNGMCSDLTRNLVPGRARPIYRKVYELVREANLRAIESVRPGMKASALDRVARRIIAKGGFGKCFGHSLGHGVGYEIHESPTVSSRCDMVLRPGMVTTIEPGIYLEGNLGVRIEDMVLVTEDGCEVLSR